MSEIDARILQKMIADELERRGGPPHDGGMDDVIRRVASVEQDMKDVKAVLGRIEPVMARVDATLSATLPHLATKAELADKPGKSYLWVVLGVLIATIFAAAGLGTAFQ